MTALPIVYSHLLLPCEAEPCVVFEQLRGGEVALFADVGISLDFYAAYFAILQGSLFAIYTALGVLVFWRKSDDKMAWLASLMLALMAVSFAPTVDALVVTDAAWHWPLVFLQVLGYGSFIIFFYLFPDGRFIPRRATILFSIVWLGVVAYAASSGNLFENSFFFPYGILIALLTSVAAQVYRYRRISSALQRQQTKWVVVGLAVFVCGVAIGALPMMFVPAIRAGDTALRFYNLVRVPLFAVVPAAFLPLGIAFSLLRYRLWDVDFVINRTLAYALTTVLLLGVLLAGYFGLRALWSVILGGDQELLAAALPAIFVIAIFNPTRQRLKHFIDWRLYGIGLNYEQVGRVPELLQSSDSGLGKYRDLEPVGRGGMGVVYRAYDEGRGGWVAVKTIHPESGGTDRDEANKRFVREAQAIASLAHPNIVGLYAVEEYNGRPYIVMEFVEGWSVAQLLEQEGRLTLERALEILRPLADALDYAHSRGIVHRDIKPGNILVEANGGRPVLMDFGIARIAALTQVTATGGMVGTLDYIAPEQIQATGEVDQRADVYSLGAMAYQMLTGKLPFQRNNAGATIFAHLMEPPPDACECVQGLDMNACEAIQKAMAKKPEERFISVGAFVAALTG